VKAGGPAKGPAADDLQWNSSSRAIEVAIADWRISFAVGAEPSTGELRDLAETLAAVTGVDHASALSAVVVALATAAPPRDVLAELAA